MKRPINKGMFDKEMEHPDTVEYVEALEKYCDSLESQTKVHKPFDFVESKKGSFGYIQKVSINECQDGFDDQVSYSVNWIKNVAQEHNAWWNHNDLSVLGNMFKEIAKCAVHPFGNNEDVIDKIM